MYIIDELCDRNFSSFWGKLLRDVLEDIDQICYEPCISLDDYSYSFM